MLESVKICVGCGSFTKKNGDCGTELQAQVQGYVNIGKEVINLKSFHMRTLYLTSFENVILPFVRFYPFFFFFLSESKLISKDTHFTDRIWSISEGRSYLFYPLLSVFLGMKNYSKLGKPITNREIQF